MCDSGGGGVHPCSNAVARGGCLYYALKMAEPLDYYSWQQSGPATWVLGQSGDVLSIHDGETGRPLWSTVLNDRSPWRLVMAIVVIITAVVSIPALSSMPVVVFGVMSILSLIVVQLLWTGDWIEVKSDSASTKPFRIERSRRHRGRHHGVRPITESTAGGPGRWLGSIQRRDASFTLRTTHTYHLFTPSGMTLTLRPENGYGPTDARRWHLTVDGPSTHVATVYIDGSGVSLWAEADLADWTDQRCVAALVLMEGKARRKTLQAAR
jgi:hypothetical protein